MVGNPSWLPPQLHPHGEGFVIEPATESMRVRARAVIWDDVRITLGSEEEMGSESEEGSEDFSDKILYTPGRRQRFRARIKKELKKVHDKLEKRVKKVERVVLKRRSSGVRRGVDKIKPLTKFLKGVALSTSIHDPVFKHRPWNVSTASIARGVVTEPESNRPWMTVRASWNVSASSFVGPVDTERERHLIREPLVLSETVRVDDDISEHAAIAEKQSVVVSSESVDDNSEEAVRGLEDRIQRHTEAQLAKPNELPSVWPTSISAQITAFQFTTLVPMDIVSRFPPTHRVSVKTSNTLLAQRDMMQLSNIWSQVVGPAPSLSELKLFNPLRALSGVEAERLCKLMEEGLHRWSYWALSAEASGNDKEGAMDNEWWWDFEAKLHAVGLPDNEALSQQLIILGGKYINVPALEATMEMAKALDASMSLDKESARHDSKTDLEEEVELLFPASVGEVTELETAAMSPIEPVEIASVPCSMSGPSSPVRQRSTTAIPLPVMRNADGEQITVPFRSFHLAKKIIALVKATEEEKPSQAAVDSTAHDEELILQYWCNNPLPAEEAACMKNASSSSDIMKEVQAALDAAVVGRFVSSPEPVQERRHSQIPPPLTIRKSQPTLSKHKSMNAAPSHQRKKAPVQEEPASPPVTRENGWISVDNLVDFSPEDVVYEEVVYPGPSCMSNKARGKLPMPWTPSTRTSSKQSISPRPAPKATVSRTPPRSTVPGRPVSTSVKPRVPPWTRAQIQGASHAGPASGFVACTASPDAARRRSNTPVKAGVGSKTSEIPLHPTVTRVAVQDAAMKPSSPIEESEVTEAEASRVSPDPTVTLVTVSSAAASSSSLPSETEIGSAESSRVPPAFVVPVTITKTLSVRRQSRIPVPRKKVSMPGAFPKSDAGVEE